MWGEISDLKALAMSGPNGFVPVPDYRARKLAPADETLIEAFQLGALSGDIASHRGGEQPSAEIRGLIDLISGFNDLSNYFVYRALAIDDPCTFQDPYCERSLNSWSLSPNCALNVALSQSRGPFIIMRRQLQHEDSALFIDDWEYEVLCPPTEFELGYAHRGIVGLYRDSVDLSVVDCVAKGRAK